MYLFLLFFKHVSLNPQHVRTPGQGYSNLVDLAVNDKSKQEVPLKLLLYNAKVERSNYEINQQQHCIAFLLFGKTLPSRFVIIHEWSLVSCGTITPRGKIHKHSFAHKYQLKLNLPFRRRLCRPDRFFLALSLGWVIKLRKNPLHVRRSLRFNSASGSKSETRSLREAKQAIIDVFDVLFHLVLYGSPTPPLALEPA